MLTAPFTMGVMIYAFYAMQPYLLILFGDKEIYTVAGLAAALIAGAQIAGGLLVPSIRKAFRLRTSAMLVATLFSVAALAVIGGVPNFWIVITFLILFGLTFAGISPIRQTYLNGLIPSEQRATVLSFDSLIGSSGGVVFQPLLGKSADLWNYPASYLISGAIQAAAIPFILLARKEKPPSDVITKNT
jgi:MFS family permease